MAVPGLVLRGVFRRCLHQRQHLSPLIVLAPGVILVQVQSL